VRCIPGNTSSRIHFLKSIVSQVQVKSHGGRSSNIPFALLIRDPSSHIDTLSENKKLADNVTNSQNGKEEPADYKFNILIPKLEAFYPVMKYKCTGDLRPVPIVSCVGSFVTFSLMFTFLTYVSTKLTS